MAYDFEKMQVDLIDLQDEIELLQGSDKKKAKRILAKKLIELQDLESLIAGQQKQFDLSKIAKAIDDQGKNSPASVFVSLLKQNSIDYNCKLIVDYCFSTGLAVTTIKPTVIRTSRTTVIKRNSTELPALLTVNLSDNKTEFSEFSKENEIDTDSEFNSFESFFQNVLACYTGLAKAYTDYNMEFSKRKGIKSRFDSASAKEKLSRLTRNVVNLTSFCEALPVGGVGENIENASREVG